MSRVTAEQDTAYPIGLRNALVDIIKRPVPHIEVTFDISKEVQTFLDIVVG